MKWNKTIVKAWKQTLLIGFLFVAIFLCLSFATFFQHEEQKQTVTEEVEQYRPLIKKYAKQHGVSAHEDLLLAIMMQESAGKGNDPMQASESYCGEVGCIDDPKKSIEQGVSYFATVLDQADGDVQLAIQSYNFGAGFIDYVKNGTGSYSKEVAIQFSKEMYEKAENKSDYTCLREEAKQFGACYGDISYVNSVLSYQKSIAMK